MRRLTWLLALVGSWLSGIGAAHACSCERGTPSSGYERAQYVFSGKIVEAGLHTWRVEVERVWKGRDKLARSVRLMDVYAQMDCQFFFEQGQRYIFFAILAKSGRDVFYHPQVCNWTSPLQSTSVPTEHGEQVWLEDLIAREHGLGGSPRDDRR